MAKGKKAVKELTPEEKLQQALVPVEEQPYEIPENWCWTYIGKIISVSSGKGLTAKKMNSEGTIPVYGGNGITGYHDASTVDGTTIVIGRVGAYCGCVHYIEGEAWVTDNALLVDFDSTKFSYRYLYWLLTNTDLRKNDSSSAQPVISGSKIYDLTIPVAPFAEQQRIVDRIEIIFAKLDEAKEKAQAVVDGFELRKSAILHKAFTGELTAQWRQEHGVGLDSWECTTIGNQSELITKGASPRWQGVEYTDDRTQTLFVTSENVREGYLDLSKEKYLDNKINEIQKRSVLKYGDVLVNIVGASIGRAAIFNLNQLANTNQAVCIVRLNQNVSNEFICFYLNSPTAQSYYYDNKVETARANVSLGSITNMDINLPTLLEQRQIVKILNDLLSREQQAKDTAETVIDQIDTMKKAVLARAFRGELGTNDPAEESAVELLKKVL